MDPISYRLVLAFLAAFTRLFIDYLIVFFCCFCIILGMDKEKAVEIIRGVILEKFPNLQGLYLFGSYGTPYMRQDAIVLNLQRACEASIDLALRVICMKKLGVPQSSRGVFEILEKNKLLSKEFS